MARWDDWVTLVFYVVVIRGTARTVLVGAGPPDDLTDINRVWRAYLGDDRAQRRWHRTSGYRVRSRRAASRPPTWTRSC